MITSAINVASTIPGMYAIDKWGRRPLLFWGAIGMCVSQFIVAMCGTFSTGQNADGTIFVKNLAGQKAAVSFVCIYIFFFASTWGPLAWVVTGEIFPLKTRAKSLSMTTATNWLFNWAIGKFLLITNFYIAVTNMIQPTLLPTSSTTAPERPTSSPRSSSSGSAAVSCALPLSTSSSMKPRDSLLRRSTSSMMKSVLLASPLSGGPLSPGSTDRVSLALEARCLVVMITRERFLTTRRTRPKMGLIWCSGVCENCWTERIVLVGSHLRWLVMIVNAIPYMISGTISTNGSRHFAFLLMLDVTCLLVNDNIHCIQCIDTAHFDHCPGHR